MIAFALASLTAACNAGQVVELRAARWLLAVQDQVGVGFPIAQEHLALMIGARRPTVNAVLQKLKAAGLIRLTRGEIAVADRAGLEAPACPCYRAERERVERLLPGGLG